MEERKEPKFWEENLLKINNNPIDSILKVGKMIVGIDQTEGNLLHIDLSFSDGGNLAADRPDKSKFVKLKPELASLARLCAVDQNSMYVMSDPSTSLAINRKRPLWPSLNVLTGKTMCFDKKLVWSMSGKECLIYNPRQQRPLCKIHASMIIGEEANLIQNMAEHIIKCRKMNTRKDVIISLWSLPNLTNTKIVFSRYRKKKNIKTFDLTKLIGKNKGRATCYDFELLPGEKSLVIVGSVIMFPANSAALVITVSIDGKCEMLDYKELYLSSNSKKRVFESVVQIKPKVYLAINLFNGWLFNIGDDGKMKPISEVTFSKDSHYASSFAFIKEGDKDQQALIRSTRAGNIYYVKFLLE